MQNDPVKQLEGHDRTISALRRISGIACLLEVAAQSPVPISEESLQEAACLIREKSEEVRDIVRTLRTSN